MSEYVKKRFFKMVDYICNMSYPFKTSITTRILELKTNSSEQEFLNEISSLLLQHLISVEIYLHRAVEHYRDLMCILARTWNDPAAKSKIDRFYQYKSLKKDNVTDKDVFEKMYQDSSNQGREPFHIFYNRMRKWKHDHRQLLKNDSRRIIHENKLAYSDYDVDNNAEHDIAYFLKLLSVYGPKSKSRLDNRYNAWKEGKYKGNYELFSYHYLIQITVCIIERARWASEIYADYVEGLKEIGLITALTRPQRANELLCFVEGRKQKATVRQSQTDNQADTIRALALTKTTPYFQDVYLASINTYRHKYWELRNEYLDILTDNELAEEENEEKFIEFHIIKMILSKRNCYLGTIKSWRGILVLLYFFNSEHIPVSEQTLKDIFNVCKARRDWILPDELNLKQHFDRLEYRGFFDTLYKHLDKKAKIKEIDGIRWHKVCAPERGMKSPQDLFSPCKIHSPFWK